LGNGRDQERILLVGSFKESRVRVGIDAVALSFEEFRRRIWVEEIGLKVRKIPSSRASVGRANVEDHSRFVLIAVRRRYQRHKNRFRGEVVTGRENENERSSRSKKNSLENSVEGRNVCCKLVHDVLPSGRYQRESGEGAHISVRGSLTRREGGKGRNEHHVKRPSSTRSPNSPIPRLVSEHLSTSSLNESFVLSVPKGRRRVSASYRSEKRKERHDAPFELSLERDEETEDRRKA